MIRLLCLFAALSVCGALCVNAQQSCTGDQVFTAKDCDGDKISAEERVLHDLLNQYRESKGLRRVSQSDSLTWLANRHLLDVRFNIKRFTHSWSNCPYDPANRSTWECMSGSARRLKTGFDGDTFETLFAASGGTASPQQAMEMWKRSSLHNSMLLNQGMFASMNWEEVGIAISGNYAAFWFGSKTAGGSGGIGASFEQAVSGLTKLVRIPDSRGRTHWRGKSRDGKIAIELTGPRADLSEAEMTVSATLESTGRISPASRTALATLLTNIFPEWNDADRWLDESLAAVIEKRGIAKTKVIRKTHVSLDSSTNAIRLVFTPEGANRVREVF
jgi:hypothetical protein